MLLTIQDMLNKYKNRFFDVILTHNIDPLLFNTTIEDQKFIVTLNNSPLLFTVTEERGDAHSFYCHFIKMATGFPESPMFPSGKGYTKIDEIIQVFERWIEDHVKLYLEDTHTPNLWEIQEKFRSIIDVNKVHYLTQVVTIYKTRSCC